MRYIKKFNESVDQNELKEFCEMNLAYLLDEGYEIFVTLLNTGNYSVNIRKTDLDNYFFEWDEVKDYIIPFIVRLRNEYEIKEDQQEGVLFFVKVERTIGGKILGDAQHRHVTNSISQVINDNLDLVIRRNPIGNIFFTVINK